jgi:vaccinia related kinase
MRVILNTPLPLVQEYLDKKKLSHINLPLFLGNGSLQVQDVKHRFIVTNKFGRDLWSLFKTHKKFPFGTVLNIAKQTVKSFILTHWTEI